MLAPLAGTVSFYSKNGKLIKEIDLDEYYELTQKEFLEMIQEIEAHKVILHACYHNHDIGEKTTLYEN